VPNAAYDALVLDIDGTLLDHNGQVPRRTREALGRLRAAGVVVTLATGRAHGSTRQLMRELGLDAPAVVFNGSALYCPREDRLIARRVLLDEHVAELHALATRRNLLAIVEHGDERYAHAPRTRWEAALLDWIGRVQRPPATALAHEQTLRVALFSDQHGDSVALHDEVSGAASWPAYYTHFALTNLAGLSDNPMQGLDVQPVCHGKAEVFPVLQTRYGIAADRVVAVGDADNDIAMLTTAGLGVAMANATPGAKQAARRVIGDNTGDALAALIEELFLV
jgi:Cof subfamily protein (haloacid dehalogenase superfamily)